MASTNTRKSLAPWPRRWHIGGSLFLSCLSIASAHAAGTRDKDQPLVILTERGSKDTEDTAFFSSARALAAEIGIEVTTEEVPTLQSVRDALLAEARGQSKPFLVAWILREGKLRRVQLFDPWNNQLRSRAIEVGDSPAASAEALALILRAELVAVLAQPPPPPPPPPAPPPPKLDPRWSAAAAYSLSSFVRGAGLQQGARLGVEHLWQHVRLGLAYRVFAGEEIAGQGATVTLQRHPIDLDLGYQTHEHRRLRWGADAFLGGDWVSRHTSSAVSPLSAQPDAGHFVVSAGVRCRQELRVLGNVALGLGLGIEAPLNPVELQVVRGTTTQTVARLSGLRFIADLGVVVRAF